MTDFIRDVDGKLVATSVRIPDSITPVVGWRVWRWHYADPLAQLRSVNYDVWWKPNEPMRASCGGDPMKMVKYARDHGIDISANFAPPSPVDGCTCGIYALAGADPVYALGGADPNQLRYLLESPSPLEVRVLGKVALWGKVVIAQDGYRAEYAYPQELFVPDTAFNSLSPALEKYGVPVRKWSEQYFVALVPDAHRMKLEFLVPPAKLTPQTPSDPWWLRALLVLCGIVLIGVFALQVSTAARALWWGASGATELRAGVSAVIAFAATAAAVWTVSTARRIILGLVRRDA